MRKIMACLDVGSDTIKLVVGEMVKKKLNILAVCDTPSRGVKNGIVEEPNLMIKSLDDVIQKCEEVIGLRIKQLILSIPSNNATFSVVEGTVPIENEGNLIEGHDVIRVFQKAIKSKLSEKEFEEYSLSTLLVVEYDNSNAIIDIHPGAVGTESQDWADMLYRMYIRYAEKNNFKIQMIDYLEGDGAGLKSVSFMLKGKNVYGLLKAEKGVHRLVRISPFDSSGRRHTSFASVEVTPEISDDVNIVIEEKDLRIDTYRSSGAGGQNVNRTDSAVRITHIPTGIVVTCQNERNQIKNRETAMSVLKSRLFLLKLEEQKKKLSDIQGEQKNIEWGSQIRSYVFCPYTMVKDHRTNYEVTAVHSVLDGEIDDFIYAYLKCEVKNNEIR